MHRDDAETQALLDGRYQLGECIGEGGMARVHRGEDLALGRTVAIKVLRPGAEGLATPGRARAEMTVLASLSHPSLVTLFDAQIAPGRPDYLVMEFIDGPTLSERLEGGPLPADEVAQLALELAEALHVVHAAGIVHRDLKPSNVLLSPAHLPGRAYRAKLADFGIAFLLGSGRTTTPGMVVGTADYLAPEQVRGAEPAPPADIYSLGLVLLEALTGNRAFAPATGMESVVARLTISPTIPEEVPSDVAALLREMTAMDPAARPTAIDVAAAVARRPLAGASPVEAAGPVVAATAEPAPAAGANPTHPERLGATAPTRTLPAHPAAGPVPPIGSPRPPSRRGRSRRVVGVGVAAAAVTALTATAFWLAGNEAGVPAPETTVPAVTEASPNPTVPAEEAVVSDDGEAVDPAVVPVDDTDTTPTDDGTAPADEAPVPAEETPDGTGAAEDGGETEQGKAEDAGQKAEEAQQKAAEQAQRAAQKAEEARLREEAKSKTPPPGE